MDNLGDSKSSNKKLTLVKINTILLGFQHNTVLTIDNISYIHSHRATNRSSGTLHFDSSKLPVYTFDEELTLLKEPTHNNRFCIVLKHSKHKNAFSITCDAIEHYEIEDNNSIRKVPALTHNPDSPVIGLIKKESTLVFLTSVESMCTYIKLQESKNA